MCRSAFVRGLSNSQAVCPKHGIRAVPSLRSTWRHLPRRKFLVSFSNRELGRAPTLHENPPSDRVRGRLRALPRSIDGVLTPYADAYFRGIGLHRESDATTGSPSEPPPEGRVGRQPRSEVKFSCGDGSGEPRSAQASDLQRARPRMLKNAQGERSLYRHAPCSRGAHYRSAPGGRPEGRRTRRVLYGPRRPWTE